MWISERLNSIKEKTHLQRTHGTAGKCLRRYLSLKFSLLWHSGEANITPHCVSQNQLWQQNHIMLTQCCPAHRGGSHHNSCSDGCSEAHNCHMWSSSSSNGHSNLQHNSRHTEQLFIRHSISMFMPIQYIDSHASSLFFFFLMLIWLLWSWFSACFWSCLSITIHLAFSIMPSITVMSSLNVHYDLIFCGTSFLLSGHPFMVYVLSCCRWPSLAVVCCIPCVVMQLGLSLSCILH